MNKKKTRYYFEDRKRLINWEWVFVTGCGTALYIVNLIAFFYMLFGDIFNSLGILFFINFWIIAYATLYYQFEKYEKREVTRRYYLKEERA